MKFDGENRNGPIARDSEIGSIGGCDRNKSGSSRLHLHASWGGGGGCEMLPSAAGFVMDPVTESNAAPPRYEELVSPMRFTSTGQMKLGQKV